MPSIEIKSDGDQRTQMQHWRQALLTGIARVEPDSRRSPSIAVKLSSQLPFSALMDYGDIDHLAFCQLQMAPHTMTTRLPQSGHPQHPLACFQVSGHTSVQQGRRSIHLLPGQWTLIDGALDFCVTHHTAVKQIVLSSRSTAWTQLAPFSALLFSGTRGLKKIVYDLACNSVTATPLSSQAAADLATSISHLLYHATLEPPASEQASRAQLSRDRVADFIHTELQNPQLSVTRIAQHFGTSTRSVHRAFRSTESVERYILKQRLMACATVLLQPGAQSLTQLAYQYGFASPAHFSRAFRQVHDMSPSQWRRLHVTALLPPPPSSPCQAS
jgi:AraC-like DNA-binding protein